MHRRTENQESTCLTLHNINVNYIETCKTFKFSTMANTKATAVLPVWWNQLIQSISEIKFTCKESSLYVHLNRQLSGILFSFTWHPFQEETTVKALPANMTVYTEGGTISKTLLAQISSFLAIHYQAGRVLNEILLPIAEDNEIVISEVKNSGEYLSFVAYTNIPWIFRHDGTNNRIQVAVVHDTKKRQNNPFLS